MSADHSDSNAIAQRMKDSCRKLHTLAISVGSARTVREFSTDRRKNLLAKYVAKALKDGESATAAETIGRANVTYQEELEILQEQHQAAETTIAKFAAEQCSFEATRSLLSFEKQSMRDL